MAIPQADYRHRITRKSTGRNAMSTDLIHAPPRRLSRRERQLGTRLRDAQIPGQVAAAKIESAAFTARTALSHAAMLSGAEARAIEYAPLGEARYKAICDSFAGYCCEELTLLAFR
jgi:hypothetical protein